MKRFLLGKEKIKEIWRSVKEGPRARIRQVVRDVVITLMCKDDTCQPPLPANDAEKLHAYQIVFYEMVFSVQPSLFEHIML